MSGELLELPPIGAGERVSAAAVMALVRERSARRRAAGRLTDDEVEALARERFRRYGEQAHIDPRLLDRLLDSGVAHDWNIATDYVIRTHRTGPAAALLVALKRMVAPIVRLYTDHVLDRQTQVNQYLYRVLHASVRDVVRLEARLEALEKRDDLAGGKRPGGLGAEEDGVVRRSPHGTGDGLRPAPEPES